LGWSTAGAFNQMKYEAYIEKYPEAVTLIYPAVITPADWYTYLLTFTATAEQLEVIEQTFTSEEYQSAIESSYEAAVASCSANEVAIWTAEDGYTTISLEELGLEYGVWL